MRFKTVDDFNFKGKRVLLRADLNSPIQGRRVILNDRIIESAKTIRELIGKGAAVTVIAHQGQNGKSDFISLEQHGKLLNKFVKIKFVKDIIGEKAKQEIERLGFGEALLLDNVRFEKDEFKPSMNNKIARAFRGKFDFYVNDAFSVCHRKQTSIVVLPKLFKSCIGRTMQREVESLEKIKIKNCLYILGGEKVEDLVPLLNRKKMLTGGILSLVYLKAKGYNLGEQEKVMKDKFKIISKIKNLGSAEIPRDLVIDVDGKKRRINVDELPIKYRIYDIGKKTAKIYSEEIRKAKTIFMKGPMGHCERGFTEGTRAVLQAIAKAGGFSVIGGGHTASEIKRFGLSRNDFGYVSLSGGATLDFIAGKKLPGLEALKSRS